MDALDGMSEKQLEQLLESAQSLQNGRRRGATVAELVSEFGGSIPEDELNRMESAIEEDCERIDPD